MLAHRLAEQESKHLLVDNLFTSFSVHKFEQYPSKRRVLTLSNKTQSFRPRGQ